VIPLIIKVDEDVYEYKEGGAGCLIGPPLIAWEIVRLFHLTPFGLQFTAPITWVDWAILLLGITSFWLPGRKFLRIDRKKKIVTVYQGSPFNPASEQTSFRAIEKIEVKSLRRYANDNSQHTAMFMQLRDGRDVLIKKGSLGYESAVRTARDLEKVIGIYGGSEPDEDGLTGEEESAKALRSLDGMYKIRKFFVRRRSRE
jgi:hypothetical protein